jgi:hypothetical protein
MSILAIDLGHNSIKLAKSSENSTDPEHFEIPFQILIDPENRIVTVGDDAINRYLRRNSNLPLGVRLFEEDLRNINMDQLQIIMQAFLKSAKESYFYNDSFELILVSFDRNSFVIDNYVDTVIDLIKDIFYTKEVVALNEPVAAASLFHVSPDIKLREGIICDLGKNKLKFSYFKTENDAIVCDKQAEETYSNLEERFLNDLVIPSNFPEPQKIQVENLFRTVYGDMDNSKEYKNALDYRVMNDDGGLPSSPFFEIPLTEELRAAKIKKSFSYKEIYDLYSNFANDIVDKLSEFIDDVEELNQTKKIPICIIGAPARVPGFDDLLRQSGNDKPLSFFVPSDSKYAIVDGSIDIVLHKLNIYPDFTGKLQYKEKLIKNGKIVFTLKDIETSKTLKLGEMKELSFVSVESDTCDTCLYLNDKELKGNVALLKGSYHLWQSVSRFGKPVFYLTKSDEANPNPIILKEGEQQNV